MPSSVSAKPAAPTEYVRLSSGAAASAWGSTSFPLSSRTSVVKPGSSSAPTKPSVKNVSAQSSGYLGDLKQGDDVGGLSSFAGSTRSSGSAKPAALNECVQLSSGAAAGS